MFVREQTRRLVIEVEKLPGSCVKPERDRYGIKSKTSDQKDEHSDGRWSISISGPVSLRPG